MPMEQFLFRVLDCSTIDATELAKYSTLELPKTSVHPETNTTASFLLDAKARDMLCKILRVLGFGHLTEEDTFKRSSEY